VKIDKVIPIEGNGGAYLYFTNYPVIEVDHLFMAKHNPSSGGYYVIYDDGYTSWSPAKSFEEGYTLIMEEQEYMVEGYPMKESKELMDYLSDILEEGLHIYMAEDKKGQVIVSSLPIGPGVGLDIWEAIKDFRSKKENK
jgi:hypothetical protein